MLSLKNLKCLNLDLIKTQIQLDRFGLLTISKPVDDFISH